MPNRDDRRRRWNRRNQLTDNKRYLQAGLIVAGILLFVVAIVISLGGIPTSNGGNEPVDPTTAPPTNETDTPIETVAENTETTQTTTVTETTEQTTETTQTTRTTQNQTTQTTQTQTTQTTQTQTDNETVTLTTQTPTNPTGTNNSTGTNNQTTSDNGGLFG